MAVWMLVVVTPAQAQICFRPRPLAACKSLLITEFAVGAKVLDPATRQDDVYYTGEFGWMVNVAGRSALGGALQLGIDDESDYRIGLKPRYRHWFTAMTSIDVAAGLLLFGDGVESPGFTGHVAVNFSRIVGAGIRFEAYDEEFQGNTTRWYVTGRLAAEAGVAAGLAGVVVLLVVAIAGGVTS
jgi:hypothetical protein